jgi:hypothetical protein
LKEDKYNRRVIIPNPVKPGPVNLKDKNETKKIEFGTQELTKVKTQIS